jgi:hypothetical protein
MSDGKPRKSGDPLYFLLREGGSEELNRRSKSGEKSDFRGICASLHPNAPEIIGPSPQRSIPNALHHPHVVGGSARVVRAAN